MKKVIVACALAVLTVSGVALGIASADSGRGEGAERPDELQTWVDQAAASVRSSTGQRVGEALVFSGDRAMLLAAVDGGSVPGAERTRALLIEFDGPFESVDHPMLVDSKPEPTASLVYIVDASTGEMLDGGGLLEAKDLSATLGRPIVVTVD